MVEDVRLAVNGKSDVYFYGRPGGAIFSPDEVQEQIKKVYGQVGIPARDFEGS
jgi:2-oxoglutarate/2-oxoacid ferredoxin oxidoreductase subunit alpha